MRRQSVPVIEARYWVGIILASVFGTNSGDFVSRILHLGHISGLAPLAAVFAAILVAERLSPRGNEAFYWLAIVTLRTAATNIADLAVSDLKLSAPLVLCGLAALLVLTLVPDLRRGRPVLGAAGRATDAAGASALAVPTVDLRYWTTMLLAGTLGTVAGDIAADALGLGAGLSAVLFSAAFTLLVLARRGAGLSGKAMYWFIIVIARTAGTDVGDFLASRRALGLGLPLSTSLTCAVFVLTLLLWPRRRVAASEVAKAGLREPV